MSPLSNSSRELTESSDFGKGHLRAPEHQSCSFWSPRAGIVVLLLLMRKEPSPGVCLSWTNHDLLPLKSELKVLGVPSWAVLGRKV